MILAAVGMTREARLVQGPQVRAVAGGGRADLLEQRLKAALDGGGFQAVVSVGLGGALDPALRVGDIVIGTEALRPRSRWEADPGWSARMAQRLPQARRAAVYGANDMVLHALDKAKLRRQGAALVDMESHVAARLATARGLPFAILRVVSDTAGVSLPPAVAMGLKPNGDEDLWGVLGALAGDPRQLPALMRVGREAGQAFRALDAARRALGEDLGFAG